MHTIGLISDTHDVLRPEALNALEGVDHIIHGGDITQPWVLDALGNIAPVTAVRGNNDTDAWAMGLPESASLQFDQVLIHILHDLKQLPQFEPPSGVRVILSGHSHKPSIQNIDSVLHVNPGSAGRRRFKLPISLGELVIDGDQVHARIIELEIAPVKGPSRSRRS